MSGWLDGTLGRGQFAELRYSAEDTVEAAEWFAHLDLPIFQSELSKAALVRAAPLFDDGNGLFHSSLGFEVTQENDRIGKISEVDGRLHVGDEPLLGKNHQSEDALMIKVGEELMQLEGKKAFFGHGIEVAIDAVDDDEARLFCIHAVANARHEFAG